MYSTGFKANKMLTCVTGIFLFTIELDSCGLDDCNHFEWFHLVGFAKQEKGVKKSPRPRQEY